MKLFVQLFLFAVIGRGLNSQAAAVKDVNPTLQVNPIEVTSHMEEIRGWQNSISFARFRGLPTHRAKRSFGTTNPIVLKVSSLAGPYAPVVLKAAKIFCKITGPGIFC